MVCDGRGNADLSSAARLLARAADSPARYQIIARGHRNRVAVNRIRALSRRIGTAVDAPDILAQDPSVTPYRLEAQIGFILRLVSQRHSGIFADGIGDELTPTRFAALAKLYEIGPMSQNQLGRRTAMDGATIKGVVDRLRARGLVRTRPDPTDARRHLVELTDAGRDAARRAIPRAREITEKTLEPLGAKDRKTLLELLYRLS
jgi:MarR family transcriptional regulator, lower aerobic nicotinate degradation pathway regulator